MTLPYRHPACPFDTDGDGDCGRPECPYCRGEREETTLAPPPRELRPIGTGLKRPQALCYLR